MGKWTPADHVYFLHGSEDVKQDHYVTIARSNAYALQNDVDGLFEAELKEDNGRRYQRELKEYEVAQTQGRYVPLCDHDGWVINDPVLLKLSDDCYWLSVADSDIHLWAIAIAHERDLDIQVSDPDVSLLAVQGPKAVEVAAKLFGEQVRDG